MFVLMVVSSAAYNQWAVKFCACERAVMCWNPTVYSLLSNIQFLASTQTLIFFDFPIHILVSITHNSFKWSTHINASWLLLNPKPIHDFSAKVSTDLMDQNFDEQKSPITVDSPEEKLSLFKLSEFVFS